MKLYRLCIIGVAAIALLTGCSTIYKVTQAKHENATDFLPDSGRLQRQSEKFPFQLFYMKADAPRPAALYIAPVNTAFLRKAENWEKFDQKLAGKLGQDIQSLADFMRERLIAEFKQLDRPGKPQLVDSPHAKNCAVIETAIVAIVPTKAELNAMGVAGNLIAPGISVVASHFAAGSISVECKIRNSDTGEVVAMYSATMKDPGAILNLNNFSWYGSAKKNIEKTAKDTITIFATRDYSAIKRDFPIQLISL